MAATDWLHRAARVLGGLLALHPAGPAGSAEVPADDAEAMIHVYDGGGVRAAGPALLVRKSLADRVSASASYYVDAVSNASIDVVTTASPFKETRNEVGLGLDYAVRDALITVSFSRSKEPDYTASSVGLDVAQDVFGGMTTVSMGFSRGRDEVGKAGDPGFADQATHWQYRVGATQVLSPTWLMSANFEAIADEGLLGSPYRAARVFGAAVPERLPRTRSSRALKLRAIGAVGEVSSVRAEYRYYWDTWALQGHTVEFGGACRLGDGWLAEATLRLHSQNSALFYSDNAAAETEYITRNRQLSAFRDWGVGAKLSTDVPHLPATWKLRATMGYEFKRFDFQDFTDLRTGTLYAHNAHLLQINVSAPF